MGTELQDRFAGLVEALSDGKSTEEALAASQPAAVAVEPRLSGDALRNRIAALLDQKTGGQIQQDGKIVTNFVSHIEFLKEVCYFGVDDPLFQKMISAVALDMRNAAEDPAKFGIKGKMKGADVKYCEAVAVLTKHAGEFGLDEIPLAKLASDMLDGKLHANFRKSRSMAETVRQENGTAWPRQAPKAETRSGPVDVEALKRSAIKQLDAILKGRPPGS